MSESDKQKSTPDVFERVESNVRSYCRSIPAEFSRARGALIWDVDGTEYIDFFAGAGALNYGHNHPRMTKALIDYVADGGITHSLDLKTSAKRHFLEHFEAAILKPRNLPYKVQFPGPTGTNAVEAALKLARKVTGRQSVVSFTNGFHGMTMGALSVTGNTAKREGAGVPLPYTATMPYDGYLGDEYDTIDYLRQFIVDGSSGLDKPAAFIVETVQGEGGLNVASNEWLQKLAAVAKELDILLIVDDIQAGCGRTGTFFSFEPAGIVPDIVTMSKSLSGIGQPFAVVLFRPELDEWDPGEHNGTFRGNNYAFVTAAEVVTLWQEEDYPALVAEREALVRETLEGIRDAYPSLELEVKGRGLFIGLSAPQPGVAEEIAAEAYRERVIMETSGPESEVAKIMPPINIELDLLREGLERVRRAADRVLAPLAQKLKPGEATASAGGDAATSPSAA